MKVVFKWTENGKEEQTKPLVVENEEEAVFLNNMLNEHFPGFTHTYEIIGEGK